MTIPILGQTEEQKALNALLSSSQATVVLQGVSTTVYEKIMYVLAKMPDHEKRRLRLSVTVGDPSTDRDNLIKDREQLMAVISFLIGDESVQIPVSHFQQYPRGKFVLAAQVLKDQESVQVQRSVSPMWRAAEAADAARRDPEGEGRLDEGDRGMGDAEGGPDHSADGVAAPS